MLNADKQRTNVEIVDLLYDKNSSDPALNWGKPNGIQSNTITNNLDFTKYKKLRFYFQAYFKDEGNTGVSSSCCIMDFDNYSGTTYKAGMLTPYYAGAWRNMGFWATVPLAKNSLYVAMMFDGSTQSGTSYFVYKIEGIRGGGRRKLSLLHRIFHRGGAVC